MLKRAHARVINVEEKRNFIAEKLAFKKKSDEFWFYSDYYKKYFRNIRFTDTGPEVFITLILYGDDTDTNKNKLGIYVEPEEGEIKRFRLYEEVDMEQFGITRKDLDSSKLDGLERQERYNVQMKLRLNYTKIRQPVEAIILKLLNRVDGFWDYVVKIPEDYGKDTMLQIKF